ncbi:hypothetical protein [Sphingomonas sp. UYEF23]|uniref:hypothetical protein n=1 Tax=Sphingomonas sp. UYEF23 TaxID=1756408 RepID=UPI003395144F
MKIEYDMLPWLLIGAPLPRPIKLTTAYAQFLNRSDAIIANKSPGFAIRPSGALRSDAEAERRLSGGNAGRRHASKPHRKYCTRQLARCSTRLPRGLYTDVT